VDRLGAPELLWLHARLAALLETPAGIVDLQTLHHALGAAARCESDLFAGAAALGQGVVKARAFQGGNLPMGAAAAGLLLRRYDLDLQLATADMPALRALLVGAATEPLATWLRAHTVPLAEHHGGGQEP